MRIRILKAFRLKFNKQLVYIAQDKPGASRKFRKDVFDEIKMVQKMPYKHRQSVYFTDSNVRELSFKGYLIIYRIRPEHDEIEVFGFIKYTKEP